MLAFDTFRGIPPNQERTGISTAAGGLSPRRLSGRESTVREAVDPLG